MYFSALAPFEHDAHPQPSGLSRPAVVWVSLDFIDSPMDWGILPLYNVNCNAALTLYSSATLFTNGSGRHETGQRIQQPQRCVIRVLASTTGWMSWVAIRLPPRSCMRSVLLHKTWAAALP
jgi:hypothetical protein